MKTRPSRWYYGLAVLALVAGFAGFIYLLVGGLTKITGRLTQVVVPGERELTLSEVGSYTIFHEHQSVVGSTVYSMAKGGIAGLQCNLVFSDTGERISLHQSAMKSSYSLGSRSGVSIFRFHVESPGDYVLSAQYASGEKRPEAVLAVGHGFGRQLFVIIFGSIAIMFGTVGSAIVIGVVTFVKRRSSPQQSLEIA